MVAKNSKKTKSYELTTEHKNAESQRALFANP